MKLLRTTALTAALMTAAIPLLTSDAQAWRGWRGCGWRAAAVGAAAVGTALAARSYYGGYGYGYPAYGYGYGTGYSYPSYGYGYGTGYSYPAYTVSDSAQDRSQILRPCVCARASRRRASGKNHP